MAAQKKKTGAKRKPAHRRPPSRSNFHLVMATALRSVANMTVMATVSATVLGGLLAVKHLGV